MAKARHAKRRLTSREFLARYDQILVQDGKVEFKTDNKELFEFSLEEVEEAGWNLEAFTFDLHHNEEMVQGNVMTEYEEKFSSMGNPICKMVIFQRVSQIKKQSNHLVYGNSVVKWIAIIYLIIYCSWQCIL